MLHVNIRQRNIIYAAMGDNFAYAWDLNKGECVATFAGHTEYLHCIKVDPGNNRLFTGSEDSTVRIWGKLARMPIGLPLKISAQIIQNLY